MKKCPFFGKCGGCKFDFTSDDYRESKKVFLQNLPITNNPVWIEPGKRRRADFSFLDNVFGFYQSGSKNVIPINNCPALTDGLNKMLPEIASMPWLGGGNVLVTECENGIDVSVLSSVPYFTSEFKKAADNSRAIRITWNDKIVKQIKQPIINFDDIEIDYQPNTFLQPSKPGEEVLRKLVNLAATGSKKVADLFCGQGSFTFALNADGFDIVGGIKRDLLKKPLTVHNLKKYDCVVMDPPRAGAMAQCKELAKSDVKKIIYVSCNPETFMRDKAILEQGGFKLVELTPVDQFVGSAHWELVSIFNK
ncbi:MAG: class I SAM-dependent RNA methyltransferase [Alphaproteobacteria bacterium]|nr:class I SAM-dependent RNA methyltransferase [Alphaproteobacteria bacterium]MBN2675403.1 class I SAM-dependent RNA methyltransferase [Alphaproteobacteria bacterium]